MEKLLSTSDCVSFIITENCSFECAHCMRGCRRPRSMSQEVINAFFEQVKTNGVIHLGGGEPLLRIDIALNLVEAALRKGNRPRFISIVTNGSVGLSKFEEFIKELNKMDVPLSLFISNDCYHREERMKLNNGIDNIDEVYKNYGDILRKNGYSGKSVGYPHRFVLEEYNDFTHGDPVLAIGRGKNIPGAEKFQFSKDICEYVLIYKNSGFMFGDFNITTDGRITIQAAMSWEDIDDNYGIESNILNRSIKEILTRRL